MSTPGEAIIGETFNSFVKKQIEIRQNKLALDASHDNDFLKYTHSRTSFLRLTSGVNVSNKILNELGLSGVRSKEGLAQAYVISNAQGYDTATDQYVFSQGIGYDVISSYGYTSTPEYGFVPPPGIISAAVKSLNRGSLREATINLVCHNVRQLQIIDTLFLKLRYSFLLEWGHTTYFDNTGKLIGPNEVPNMSDTFLQDYNNNQYALLEEIERERINSSGNYDAFWGVLKNFTWELTPNGTYNITLVGISTGDVIESFKINSNVTPTTVYTDAVTGIEIPKYQTSTLANVLGIVRRFVDQSNVRYIDGYNSNADWSLQSSVIASNNGNPDLVINWLDPNEKIPSETSTVSEKEAISIEFKDFPEDQKNQYYIKLGALLRLIQTFLLSYSKKTPSFKINYDYNNKNNRCLTLNNRLPLDPRISWTPIAPNSIPGSVAGNLSQVSTKFGTSDDHVANTMHMYVNIDYVIDVLEKNKDEDSKIDLYKFLTSLMGGIQPSLGSINSFKVIYTHDTNTFSIIDDKIIPYLAASSTPLAVFNTNTLNASTSGGGSFVNNFSIKTELFSKIANTIAMGAQTNGNTGISNSTTFSYLFEGITDRIITYKQNENTGINSEDTSSQSKYDQAEQDLLVYASIIPGGFGGVGDNYKFTDEFINKYTSHIPDLYGYYIGKDTNNGHFVGTGFIPLGCQLNLEGISGIKIYQTFGINSISLPPVYNNKVKFIVTGIDHKIDDKGWETSISTLSVPKRKTTQKSTSPSTINITTSNVSTGIRKGKTYTYTTPSADTWQNLFKNYIRSKEGYTPVGTNDQGTARAGYGIDKVLRIGNPTPEKIQIGTKVSINEAENTLDKYAVPTYSNPIIKDLGQTNWDKLSNNQKAALVILGYNVGSSFISSKGYGKKIKTFIEQNNLQAAGETIYTDGPRTGKVDGYLPGLEKRRKEESILFLTPDGKVETITFTLEGKP